MSCVTDFLTGSSPYVYLFIFFGKLVEVALASLRSQLILKGQRLPGAIVALFEYTFWLFITASALKDFADDPLKIVILICAFALGNVMGSIIEEKMALGYCTITGIFMDKSVALNAADLLREKGQALTIIPAEGIQGAERTALIITAKRKDISVIKKLLFSADSNAVITIQSMQQVKGATTSSTMK